MKTRRNYLAACFMICALLAVNIFTLSVSAAPCSSSSAEQVSSPSAVRSVPGWHVVVADGPVNVRSTSNPTNNNNIIGSLVNGQKVFVYSRNQGWAQIIYNGRYAYVSTTYLKEL